MKKHKKIIVNASLLVLVGVLSSCGYGLKELYDGDAYNSPIYSENYYRVYNNDIDPNNEKNKIEEIKEIRPIVTSQTYYDAFILDNDIPKSFEEENNKDLKKLTYADYGLKDNPEYVGVQYGPTKKMSSIDSTFSRGYVSKLFDGQMFCNGDYELSRVQIDEGGFGTMFQKEVVSQNGAYFALNFKGSGNFIADSSVRVRAHYLKIDLHVSFYLKTGNGYKQVRVSNVIEKVPANANESYSDKAYVFYAFSLAGNDIDITRCAGVSISYDLLEVDVGYDGEDKYENDGTIERSLMLYEMLMPKTVWR